MCDNEDDDDNDDEDDDNDDDLESLAVQSGKLSLHDTGGSRSAHTDTHTRAQRGETIGRAVRGLLYACVLGVQKERAGESEQGIALNVLGESLRGG